MRSAVNKYILAKNAFPARVDEPKGTPLKPMMEAVDAGRNHKGTNTILASSKSIRPTAAEPRNLARVAAITRGAEGDLCPRNVSMNTFLGA